jgi:hypothetical protein
MKIRMLTILVLLISLTGRSQGHFDPQTLELIKTKKIAFMTEAIGLTSQEAEKFWPVYNELEKQRFQIMDKKRELEEKSDSPKPGMSDADYRKLAIEIAATHAKEGKLIEEYNLKLLNVLPAEKVVKLYRAEGKFRATLMHEFRKGQSDKDKKEKEVKK